MKEMSCRDYSTKPAKELALALGVSPAALRARAMRLGLRKTPEAMVSEAKEKAAIEKANALRKSRAHNQ
jgi:hypothetical protein